ncbi:MAG: NADH-quinone oxidoreductase subunit C [Candidatus Omnitrophica bacterium]|nr:NADH-quinone oxidoreductase subunit C [Candidatus Omnitrophota bacterium]
MTKEENIVQELLKKFPFLKDKAKVQRVRRVVAETPAEGFEEVFVYAKEDLKFSILCTITGLDEGQALGFIYHMARTDGITFSLKFSVPKDKPVIKSVFKYFPNSDIYEREVMDLLGAEVEGLTKGNRYPLPDDWPKDEHPLRKDWKPKGTAASGALPDEEEKI